MITYLWSFSFGFFTIHNIWSFFIFTSLLRSIPEIFLYFNWWIIIWLWSTIHFQYKSLSLFPSQILECAMVFVAHYLFSFWDLHLLSSLSKKYKRVGRYIGTNLHMNQNQHDNWLIIHDKLEDRFTTITHKCQDFPHKDISA